MCSLRLFHCVCSMVFSSVNLNFFSASSWSTSSPSCLEISQLYHVYFLSTHPKRVYQLYTLTLQQKTIPTIYTLTYPRRCHIPYYPCSLLQWPGFGLRACGALGQAFWPTKGGSTLRVLEPFYTRRLDVVVWWFNGKVITWF